ncbi:SusC/RagA family TonB-linked outer membrane protein [Litoribacter populi]|uniref:SusC/RagA family TonB-linked outer membrane protein n=1 Tax=Litoribacter populi TaxID=2598460 RepID=UPI00163D3E77|nr:SusC/RagA family TonB-linked outer membrane protein [Litoribacter populi]
MKNALLTVMLWLALIPVGVGMQSQTHPVSGKVYSAEDRQPLPGALVMVQGTNNGVVTDEEGDFRLMIEAGSHVLLISFLGYEPQVLEINVPLDEPINFSLQEEGMAMDAVEIVSTGYQQLSKERATGSFVHADRELVDRRVSPNILERLEDVTPGLVFNRDREGAGTEISIRGTSTLYANAQPLIIVDNFPYDGQIENINPNDVESITVLRDAAAASIWGARAGNGVIVITTKRGIEGDRPRVTFNSNITLREQPDMFYFPQMDVGDFIGVERELFGLGYYNSQENSVQRPLISPVVETLIAERDGIISNMEAERAISEFSQRDVRRELEKYYYRPAVNQQYALNISGGSQSYRYVYSVGLDRNAGDVVDNSDSRITLNGQNHWKFLKNKLNVQAGVYYAQSRSLSGTALPQGYNSPYIHFGDEMGNPLGINRGIRGTFTDGAMGAGLLDWKYYPLAERGMMRDNSETNDLRINTTVSYEIFPGLKAEVLYQYWNAQTNGEVHHPFESFFARDMINTFTQVQPDGTLLRAVPEGGILNLSGVSEESHSLRGQLHYNKVWNKDHEFVGLGGYELKDYGRSDHSVRYYGYDDNIGVNQPVDYLTQYRRYQNNSLGRIPYGNSIGGLTDRFVSYYLNGSYTYKNMYILSASARKDASNLFGVEANQRGVPLWSVGSSWVVSSEKFYNASWLPFLKLRATYGFNGNIDKNVSAYTTAMYMPGSANALSGLRYLQIVNPPNPNLRWERIHITNLALDFESKNRLISGSLEYYYKQGLDLIGDSPFPTSTGIDRFRGNFGATESHGLDVQLVTNILKGRFGWQTYFFHSMIREKVISYDLEAVSRDYVAYGSGALGGSPLPREGFPRYSVFSYAWAGLDPNTGAPRGYINNEPSTNYAGIFSNTQPEDLIYHGPGRPTNFGSVRNDFSFGNFSLSVNVSYRLGYYFRRPTVDYMALLQGRITHEDFARRWTEPGDELITNVPSMPTTLNNNRQAFYNVSEVRIEKGDHVRLQDVRLSYTIGKEKLKTLPFRRLEVYGYANNLGILWKETDAVADPDFRTSRALRSFSMGARIEF